jgi:UDP-N-acetylglucosamine 2-epimerase
MKVLTVVGARPQFIKAAPVSRALRDAGISQYLVHTGQHYDYGMSQRFFDELDLPEVDINLGIGSGSHAAQTGEMLARIEEQLLSQKPDVVLVYGDTNSTLAGALAAVKLNIRLAHVEAGLRSFNREMPEEINRVLTDHCADLLLCPTQTAVDNLAKEGVVNGVYLVGNVMYDAMVQFMQKAETSSTILSTLGLEPKGYLLATIHRASSTASKDKLVSMLSALNQSGRKVILPLHPRTRAALDGFGISLDDFTNITVIEPVGYLDMLLLERSALAIVTDSGGIQKEAYWMHVPCVTMREETEWVETVRSGWNVLAGTDTQRILDGIHSFESGKVSLVQETFTPCAARVVELITGNH